MATTTFSEVALDHAMRPRNHGPLAHYDGHARITGPCGDTMDYRQAVSRGDSAALHGVVEDAGEPAARATPQGDITRVAIPLVGEQLSAHFGHCQSFALIDVDTGALAIVAREDVVAPPHEPGLLPKWLAERGASMIIAGGMGQRAQDLFAEQGIEVVVGAPATTPERLMDDYLAGELRGGANLCDH